MSGDQWVSPWGTPLTENTPATRSLLTQWRWRDFSRCTHLIVRPEWSSSPRRQVSLTSELRSGFRSHSSTVTKRETQPGGGEGDAKSASTPADGAASSGIKKQHTSTISWLCGAGEEEEEEEGGVDTVVERACQLRSLYPTVFLPARGRGRWSRGGAELQPNQNFFPPALHSQVSGSSPGD